MIGFASSLSFLNPTSPAFSAAAENRTRMSSATSFTASIARAGVSLSSHASIHKNGASTLASPRARSAAAAVFMWLDTRFTSACVRLSTSDRAFGAAAVPLSTSSFRCPDNSSSTRSLMGRSEVNGRWAMTAAATTDAPSGAIPNLSTASPTARDTAPPALHTRATLSAASVTSRVVLMSLAPRSGTNRVGTTALARDSAAASQTSFSASIHPSSAP
mmetsp:Transcript_8229/g.37498  ORF Transcript_8229/g.37498 Transcript_8229/m.37498 type:complete len:217 (-) Transcript_8229:2029-2679(-)